MRKSTILLMALALVLIIPVHQTVVATPPPSPPLRRSRFLTNSPGAPLSFHDCSKQCPTPGNPHATCCEGGKQGKYYCVDTFIDEKHCGGCKQMCESGPKHISHICCKGTCVNPFTDKKNCGRCGVKCRTKCTNGICDYAA